MAQDGPKEAPRWLQEGPKWAQDGPQMAHDGPEMVQDCPKMPKMAPRWPKRRPKKVTRTNNTQTTRFCNLGLSGAFHGPRCPPTHPPSTSALRLQGPRRDARSVNNWLINHVSKRLTTNKRYIRRPPACQTSPSCGNDHVEIGNVELLSKCSPDLWPSAICSFHEPILPVTDRKCGVGGSGVASR